MADTFDIQKLIQCPVCLDTYRDPRLLSCDHVICAQCAIHIANSTNELRCPVCRRKHEEYTGLDSLPKSIQIEALIGLLHKQRPPPLGKVDFIEEKNPLCPCEECLLRTPMSNLFYCHDHKHYVCAACGMKKHKPCTTTEANTHWKTVLCESGDRLTTIRGNLDAIKNCVDAIEIFKEKLEKCAAQVAYSIGLLDTKMYSWEDEVTKTAHGDVLAKWLAQKTLDSCSDPPEQFDKDVYEIKMQLLKFLSDAHVQEFHKVNTAMGAILPFSTVPLPCQPGNQLCLCGKDLSNAKQDVTIRRLPKCHHLFHNACYASWSLYAGPACPTCKTPNYISTVGSQPVDLEIAVERKLVNWHGEEMDGDMICILISRKIIVNTHPRFAHMNRSDPLATLYLPNTAEADLLQKMISRAFADKILLLSCSPLTWNGDLFRDRHGASEVWVSLDEFKDVEAGLTSMGVTRSAVV